MCYLIDLTSTCCVINEQRGRTHHKTVITPKTPKLWNLMTFEGFISFKSLKKKLELNLFISVDKYMYEKNKYGKSHNKTMTFTLIPQ